MNENTTADPEIEEPTSNVPAVIERLFLTYARALAAFFRRRLGRDVDIDDLIQEVHVRLLRADLEAVRNIEAYLFTVAANLAKERGLSQSRDRSRRDVDDPLVQEELAAVPNLDEQLDAEARSQRLHDVLHELDHKYQVVIHMHYRLGMSYEEMAAHLEVSTHLIKKHVMKALAHCRRKIAEGG